MAALASEVSRGVRRTARQSGRSPPVWHAISYASYLQVSVHEAKTSLSRLLEAAERGEEVVIARAGQMVYTGEAPYGRTFGDVPEGAPLLYLNSLMNVSLALNMGDFAKVHHIASGGEWSVREEKIKP